MKDHISAMIVAGLLAVPTHGWAQTAPDSIFIPTELTEIRHQEASLTIRDAAGELHVYAPADLEALPTYSVETTTPWRDTPARFEGVMLSDLLERHGLSSLDQIHVVAENDFVSEIPREVWESGAVMVATRVDGQPHTRRSRGPIQFIIPMERYNADSRFAAQHLVWMASEIRPAD